MPFAFQSLEIDDVMMITPRVSEESNGLSAELYRRSDYASGGITDHIAQIDEIDSTMGVIQGLHFQRSPKEQGRIIRAASGRLWVVAVDLRPGSKTFLGWISEELNETNRRMLYVPPMFAHGFAVLSDEVEIQIGYTSEFDLDAHSGIRWNDAQVGIVWPFISPVVSEADALLPTTSELFNA